MKKLALVLTLIATLIATMTALRTDKPTDLATNAPIEEELLITISGLNIKSTQDDIESFFGDCVEKRRFGRSYLSCGDAEYETYDDGSFKALHLPCRLVDGCDYSPEKLAQELARTLELLPERFCFDTKILGPTYSDILYVSWPGSFMPRVTIERPLPIIGPLLDEPCPGRSIPLHEQLERD